MLKISYILNLERLYTADSTANTSTFGLTFGATFIGAAEPVTWAQVQKNLLPWMFKPISRVVVRKSSDLATDLAGIAVVPWPTAPETKVTGIKTKVEEQAVAWIDTAQWDRFFRPPDFYTSLAMIGHADLCSAIMGMATDVCKAAFPLNLTVVFTVPEAAPDEIVAAPVFDRLLGGSAIPKTVANGNGVYQWNYDVPSPDDTDVSTDWSAHLKSWNPQAPLPDDWVDPKTYWIAPRQLLTGNLPSNWKITAQPRIEDAFDLPQRLIEAFRHYIEAHAADDPPAPIFGKPTFQKNIVAQLRLAILATLHDLAYTGIARINTSKDHLLALYQAAMITSQSSADERASFGAFKAALATYELTLDMGKWARLLLSVSPNLPGQRWISKVALLTVPVIGTVTGTVAGTVIVTDPVNGTVTGTVTVAGTVIVTVPVIGTVTDPVNGTVTVNGTMTDPVTGAVTGAMTGTMTVNGTVIGTVTVTGAVTGAVAGTMTLTGAVTGAVAGTVTVIDPVTGTVTVIDPVTGIVTGIVTDKAYVDAADPGNDFALPDLAEEFHELEALQAALANQKTLVDIVIAQWDAAVNEYDLASSLKSFWRVARPNAVDFLTHVQLRRLLARGNGAIAWRDIEAIGVDADVNQWFNDQTAAALCTYRGRLTNRGPYKDFLPHFLGDPGTWIPEDAIMDHLSSFARIVVGKLFGDMNEGNTPVPKPHPIVVHFGRITHESTVDQATDLSAHFAGALIFLSEGKNEAFGRWSCLNIADELDPGELDPVASPTYVANVLRPIRFSYIDSHRMISVDYQGHPLMAKSPLIIDQQHPPLEPVNRGQRLKQTQLAAISTIVPRYAAFPLAQSAIRPGAWANLPLPKYGYNYRAMACAVANCGALPAEIAYGHPCLLIEPPKNAAFGKEYIDGATGPCWIELKYRRRVAVAPPRIDYLGASAAVPNKAVPQAFPPVPADVFPVARELDAAGIKTDGQATLFLLPPPGTTSAVHRLSVRVPATDIDNWERWIAGIAANPRDVLLYRHKVWSEWIDQKLGQKDRNSDGTVVDRTIDDPAVKGLLFRLSPLWPNTVAAKKELFVPSTDASAGSGMASVQQPAFGMTFASGLSAQITLSTSVNVQVPEGEVWQLEIFSCCLKSEVDTYFAENFYDTLQTMQHGGVDYTLATSHRYLLEGMTRQLPSRDDLFQALSFELVGDELAVSLLNSPANIDYVHAVQLNYQVWNWNARTVPELPIKEGPYDSPQKLEEYEALRHWDVAGFGHRGDSDVLGSLKKRTLSTVRCELLSENLGTDLRRLYYRASVEVRNRYYPDVRSTFDPPNSSGLSAQGTSTVWRTDGWKRFIVPCRLKALPPTPAVRLLLLLTQGFGTAKCGLLVICNEPWYQIGGLEELLTAEICWPDVGFGAGDLLDPQLQLLKVPANALSPAIAQLLYDSLDSTTKGSLAQYPPNPAGNVPDNENAAMPLRESIARQLNDFALVHIPDAALAATIPVTPVSVDTRTWYAQGLRTEPLLARMIEVFAAALTCDMLVTRAQLVQIAEIGPDGSREGPTNGYQEVAFDGIGSAIGHTFDTEANFPLVEHTSFIVDRPKVGPNAKALADWGRALIRFRRKVLLANNTESISAPTPPRWVQYLPLAATIQGTPSFNANQLIFSADRPEPKPQGRNLDLTYLVVTRAIYDASGGEAETYIGLFDTASPKGRNWKRMGPDTGLPLTKDNIRWRTISLQARLEDFRGSEMTYASHIVDITPTITWPYFLPEATVPKLNLTLQFAGDDVISIATIVANNGTLKVGTVNAAIGQDQSFAVRLTGGKLFYRIGNNDWKDAQAPPIVIPATGSATLQVTGQGFQFLPPFRGDEPWDLMFPIDDARLRMDVRQDELARLDRSSPDAVARIVAMSEASKFA